MAKLYPPIISGTLPAFYLENSDLDRSAKITVPFTMNRAVSAAQIKGFALKIKTVQNSNYLYTALTYDNVKYNLEGSSYVTFILKSSNNSSERELLLKTFKVGLFYKLQIAYIDQNDEIGNYSSVGVSKFTTKPKVSIQGLNTNTTNNHIFNYMGVYDQTDGDSSEKVYSYCFNIFDDNDKIIATSGEKVHNTTLDTNLYTSYDIFNYNKDFETYKTYRIQYSVTTANNLQISSPMYRISTRATIESDLQADLIATADFDNGYIQINLIGRLDSEKNETITTGSFVLSRASEDDDYLNWEKLLTFKLISEFPSRELWKDFTAEQGKNYRYAIQQYNDEGLYSSRILSNIVFSDFEDAFLYDGERQLKIRFDPKLGNIKTNLAETKVDTLGYKYPFFFRNSEINYKEFTIAGLLSFLGDEKFFFISKDELNLGNEPHRHGTYANENLNTDPVSENIARERLFKRKALDWLNDGQPKLFRSPHEGNFIVRLMKVTLNPENKLGRLLHTFSGTAYEVADYNYDNLINYNFVNIIDNSDIKFLNWRTIKFSTTEKKGNNNYVVYPINTVLNHAPTNSIKFVDMRPGQMVKLVFEDGRTEIIVIGSTGSYSLESKHTITEISLLESNLKYQDGVNDCYLTGSLTYSFLGTTPNTFSKISSVENMSVPVQQFIGEHRDILQEIKSVNYNGTWLENPKHELMKVFNIKCRKRHIEDLIEIDGIIYQGNTGVPYNTNLANQSDLMRFGTYLKTAQYSPTRSEEEFIPSHYHDYCNNCDIPLEQYEPYVYINGNQINVEHISDFDFQPDELTSLSCGNGAIVEISYYMKKIDYNIEDDDNYPDVYNAKKQYLDIKNKLDSYYYIIGVLGSYEGSEALANAQLEALTAQLRADEAIATQPYKDQIKALEDNYAIIEQQNLNAHLEMVAYIKGKILEIEAGGITPEEESDLYQYKEALWVENYEYDRLAKNRSQELQKQKDYLNSRITTVEYEYATELEYLNEQTKIQLQTVAKQRAEVLELALQLFGNNTSWNDNEWVENLEQYLLSSTDNAYAAYVAGLIESQRIQAQEESVNDR